MEVAALAPSTRKWAIVTLTLALLYVPLTALSLFQLPQSPAVAAGRGALMYEMVAEQLVVGVAFAIGAAALLKGKAWAYSWLGYVALAALATVTIGVYVQFALRNDPAVFDALLDLMRRQSPQTAAMPDEQMRGMAKMQLGILFWFTLVLSAVEAAYCIGLYLHVSGGPRRTDT